MLKEVLNKTDSKRYSDSSKIIRVCGKNDVNMRLPIPDNV